MHWFELNSTFQFKWKPPSLSDYSKGLGGTIKSTDFGIRRGHSSFSKRDLFTNQIFTKRTLLDLCNVICLDLRTTFVMAVTFVRGLR